MITAHPGDFVWRAGGAIALHARKGYRMKIACLSYGERGESQFAWKTAGVRLEDVKAQRRDEAERAAAILGAEIEFFDAGDYPLRSPTPRCSTALIDIYRELKPAFVLTHALEDPYNFDHPEAAQLAQEARIDRPGRRPQARSRAQPTPRRRCSCSSRTSPSSAISSRNVILNIDEVWETKRKAFEVLAAQKHLWEYYTRVALNRGMQGGRNSGRPMTYGEAYQRLFPEALEVLA